MAQITALTQINQNGSRTATKTDDIVSATPTTHPSSPDGKDRCESSSSSSSESSKNHHVSFPLGSYHEVMPKPLNSNGLGGKKPGSSLYNSQSSREKIVYNRPPDGGWGWVVVFASFMINLVADGISLSFGVLFVELLESFGESKSKTAWVGSIFLSIPLLTGPIASALTDHYGCRKTAIAGSILSSLGFFLGNFCYTIEYLILAFTVAGFGIALCTVTSIVAVAYYFEKRRSLATGLSVCGSGIGTFLFAPFSIYLMEKIGWRKTLMVFGGICLSIIFFGLLIRDIDIDEFESDEDSSESSSSEDDSGSEIDSDELDFIPECDEEAELSSNATSSRRSSKASAMFTRKSLFARSSRARHISECEKSHEILPRACASLINIPTYIKESSRKNPKIDDSSKPTVDTSELTFRRGGYLHNLIRYYPHLLSLFLPWSVECNDDLTVKTTMPALNTCDEKTCPKDAKLECEHLKSIFNEPPQAEKESLNPEKFSVHNESVSIIVPPLPNKSEFLNYHKNRRLNHHPRHHLARNRHRHRMHQTHLHDLTSGHLNNLRLQRGSLTYRSAMLVISKYRLKASSCPDIYRTSMATIHDSKRPSFIENMKELFSDMIDWSAMKTTSYVIFSLSNFILYACIDIPYVYLPDQAINTGSFDSKSASLLISVIGVFNTVGIVLTGYIGDKPWLDVSLIYAIFTLLSGISLAAIPLTKNPLIVYALTALYGFGISANYSLVSVILVELISLDSFAQAYGLLLLTQGIASLLGPPIVGWIYDVTLAYDLAFYLTGLCVFLSGLMVLPIVKKQNCFLWSPKSSFQRSGSESSFAFKPTNFIKNGVTNNRKFKGNERFGERDDSKVSPLLNK